MHKKNKIYVRQSRVNLNDDYMQIFDNNSESGDTYFPEI